MADQSLLVINKQILKLALQQDDLNVVLGNMLSTAECLANRFGINPKNSFFESYNLYGSGNTKNEEDLKSQLEIQTKVFRNNHHYMINKEGKYPYPENFGKTKIENIINFWKQNSKKENKIYFDNIIKVLNKNYKLVYPEQINNSGEIDPNIILEVVPKVMKDVNISRKKVKEEVCKSGVYYNNLKLEGKNEDGCSGSIYNTTNIMENEKMIFIQQISKIFNKIECYIYFNYYKQRQISLPKFEYGNKEEYEKVLVENSSYLLANLNNDLNEFKKYYKEFCFINDISKDTEINKYKTCCKKWMNAFPKDCYINMLNDLLNGK